MLLWEAEFWLLQHQGVREAPTPASEFPAPASEFPALPFEFPAPAFEFPAPGAHGDLAHALLTAEQAGKHLETIWLPLLDTIPANLYKHEQFMNYSVLKLSLHWHLLM